MRVTLLALGCHRNKSQTIRAVTKFADLGSGLDSNIAFLHRIAEKRENVKLPFATIVKSRYSANSGKIQEAANA